MVVLGLGKKRMEARVEYKDRVEVSFSYHDFINNPEIVDQIKSTLSQPKWDLDNKVWSFANDKRTEWALGFLTGQDPYKWYDSQYERLVPNRPNLYDHQIDAYSWAVAKHRVLLGAEMGTGKTLVTIETLEKLRPKSCWYVGPKSAITSVKLDYTHWQAKYLPVFMSYEEMTKRAQSEFEPPECIIFDEISRLKNPLAKRTQAGKHIAGFCKYVFGLTGTPAPKSPLDWWSYGEIICPGFIRENTVAKFRNRLALVTKEKNDSGLEYPNLVTFFDDPKKCKLCGKVAEKHVTEIVAKMTGQGDGHEFTPSVNEIANLNVRLSGMVKTVFLKDCVDLPEQIFTEIVLEPSDYMKGLAKALTKTSRNTIQALTKLRALSDGFQYHERYTGDVDCDRCNRKGCIFCSGSGKIKQYQTETVHIETPKVAALLDIMEDRDRLITFAGFTGSIDKIVEANIKVNWDYIRLDGRGWNTNIKDLKTDADMVNYFQSGKGRVNFIAHPKSAGMGLTLTASNVTVYFSNDFDSESRIQSQARNYRIGTKGSTIIDLIHLPVDRKIKDNLLLKRRLELMSMGEIDV